MMKTYTEAFKKRAVRKIKKLKDDEKFTSWNAVGIELEVTGTTLCTWFNDPRLNEDRKLGSLPVDKDSKQLRAKKLVATKFNCPHCGGPITLED